MPSAVEYQENLAEATDYADEPSPRVAELLAEWRKELEAAFDFHNNDLTHRESDERNGHPPQSCEAAATDRPAAMAYMTNTEGIAKRLPFESMAERQEFAAIASQEMLETLFPEAEFPEREDTDQRRRIGAALNHGLAAYNPREARQNDMYFLASSFRFLGLDKDYPVGLEGESLRANRRRIMGLMAEKADIVNRADRFPPDEPALAFPPPGSPDYELPIQARFMIQHVDHVMKTLCPGAAENTEFTAGLKDHEEKYGSLEEAKDLKAFFQRQNFYSAQHFAECAGDLAQTIFRDQDPQGPEEDAALRHLRAELTDWLQRTHDGNAGESHFYILQQSLEHLSRSWEQAQETGHYPALNYESLVKNPELGYCDAGTLLRTANNFQEALEALGLDPATGLRFCNNHMSYTRFENFQNPGAGAYADIMEAAYRQNLQALKDQDPAEFARLQGSQQAISAALQDQIQAGGAPPGFVDIAARLSQYPGLWSERAQETALGPEYEDPSHSYKRWRIVMERAEAGEAKPPGYGDNYEGSYFALRMRYTGITANDTEFANPELRRLYWENLEKANCAEHTLREHILTEYTAATGAEIDPELNFNQVMGLAITTFRGVSPLHQRIAELIARRGQNNEYAEDQDQDELLTDPEDPEEAAQNRFQEQPGAEEFLDWIKDRYTGYNAYDHDFLTRAEHLNQAQILRDLDNRIHARAAAATAA